MPIIQIALLLSLVADRDTALRAWAELSSRTIEQKFALTDSQTGVYRDKLDSDQAAFAWPLGVQLSALTAAASVDEARVPRLRQVIDASDSYWREDATALGGYCATPNSKGALDRYYDDNAWLALALVEAYRVTHSPADLRRALATLRFVLSGEDATLGGGLWWHEINRKSKNTCSAGPAIAACLAIDSVTDAQDHLAIARRIHDWVDTHLRDEKDGLYFDNVRLDGSVDRTKWSYNSALMIRVKCMLFDATRDRRFLDDVDRTASAARKRWVDEKTGAISDDSQFAHLLAESFLELADRQTDPAKADEWRAVVFRSLKFVHDHNADMTGLHPKRWEAATTRPVEHAELIWQASASRAYWRALRPSHRRGRD